MGAQPAARALLHIYLFDARDFLVAGGSGDSVTVMVPNQEITGRTLDNCNCPRVHGQNSVSCTEVSVRLLSREIKRGTLLSMQLRARSSLRALFVDVQWSNARGSY